MSGALLQPRRLALLAVLARAGERGVSRDRLLTLFWPDDDDERARRALTQAIYALRRDLGAESAIVGTQELRLDPEQITSDIGEFTALLKSGQHADAITRYAGPFLQGFHLVGASDFERWADDERTAIGHEYARALERLGSIATRDGNTQDAAEYWRLLASVDPLNATVAVEYMRALESLGDRSGALRHARVYEALMAQELELPPDSKVVELAAALRSAPERPSQERSAGRPQPMVGRVTEATVVPANDPPVASMLESPSAPAASGIAVPVAAAPSRWPMWWLAVAAMLVLFAGAVLMRNRADHADDVARLRVVDTRRVSYEETLELDPAMSPDGHVVAYASGPEGAMRIYVRQIGGSGAPVMVSGNVTGDHRRPRWSPDGTRLLFQAQRGIWMIPALGGQASVVVEPPADTLTRASYATWSPDAKAVAWAVRDAVYTRVIDGGAPKRLAMIPVAHSLSWSPNGAFLAVASENEGFVYGAVGPLGYMGSNVGNIGPGAIYVVRVATGDTIRVTGVDHLATSPDWLGDSRRIVYVSNRDGARDLYVRSIDAEGQAAGEPVRLTTGLDAHTVSVANDGRTLAYTTFRQSTNLWSIDIPRSGTVSVANAKQLTQGQQVIEAMDVSPDGAWIAYDSDLGGQQDLFRVRTDGSGVPERIITSPTDDFHPFWSPDGRSIVFYRIRDGVRRGAVVSSNGGTPHFIGPPGGTLEEHSPVWTPDGAHLIFQRYGPSHPDLYEIARQSDSVWSAPIRLTTQGGTGPTFSPDGQEFAYLSKPGEISLLTHDAPESTRRIVATAASGSRLTAIQLRWVPGRRALYVRAHDGAGHSAIYEMPLDGGPWRALVRFDDPRRPVVRHEFATDGRRFYFTLAERVADVWTARIESR